MPSILIKNIGAIKNSGKLLLSPVTVFCGKQGSGKSTVAKLISTFMWLEKALVRKDINASEITSEVFLHKYCAYHYIDSFFSNDSFFFYDGNAYRFEYNEQTLSIETKDVADYLMPQIMYIPAERNFMMAVENAERISNLPPALTTLQYEYQKALKNTPSYKISINGYNVEYDNNTKTVWLSDSGKYRIRTFEAASGLQSFIPISVVTEYLLDKIKNGSSKQLSVEENSKLNTEISNILDNKLLDENLRKILIENINKRFKNKCLWNIVEEPEQNLFPESQTKVLETLLSAYNRFNGNGLIITTHSPYILNGFSLSAMAAELKQKFSNNKEVLKKLYKIVPENSVVSNKDLSIFEIKNNGTITKLNSYSGIPSDDNFLNNYLEKSNDLFNELLGLEAEYDG